MHNGYWAILGAVLLLVLTGALARVGERGVDYAFDALGLGGLRRYRLGLREWYRYHSVGFLGRSVDVTGVYEPVEYDPGSGRRDRVSATFGRLRRLVILGPAGAGKSMLVKHTLLEWSRAPGWWRRRDVPILVDLQRLGETSGDLGGLVVREMERSRIGRPPRRLAAARRRGRFFFLFDGLDEVPAGIRDQAVVALRDFSRDYPLCRMVVTCREAAYAGELTHMGQPFSHVAIAELDDAAMLRLLRQLGFLRGGEARLVEILRGRPALLRMARNPLLLTIIAYVHANTAATPAGPLPIPVSRADFYGVAIDLLTERDERNAVAGSPARFSPADQREALRDLALGLIDGEFGPDHVTIGRGELIRYLGQWLEKRGQDRRGEDLLATFVERSQLLEPAGLSVLRYRFRHATFRDALAAQRLGDRPEALTARYVADPDEWNETVLLWAGASGALATLLVAELAGSGDPRHQLLALEILTESAEVDPALAQRLVDHFTPRLAAPSCEQRIIDVAGQLAGQELYSGPALYAWLREAALSAAEPLRSRARDALAVTNLADAADLLVALLEADRTAMAPILRMGQVALSALAASARSGSPAAVDVIALIGTPDATLTMVELLGRSGPVAERAAWRLATRTGDEATVEMIRRVRREKLTLDDNARALADSYQWVLEPFAGGRGVTAAFAADGSTALPVVLGYVAALLKTGTEPIPEDVVTVDWRLALPLAVIGVVNSAKVSRVSRWTEFVRSLDLPLRRRRAASLDESAATVDAIDRRLDDPLTPPARRDVAEALAKIADPRHSQMLAMLPRSVIHATLRSLVKRRAPRIDESGWVAARRKTPEPTRLGQIVGGLAAGYILALVIIGGYRLVAAFFTSAGGPVWPSWLVVGAAAVAFGSVALNTVHEDWEWLESLCQAALGVIAVTVFVTALLQLADWIGGPLAVALLFGIPVVILALVAVTLWRYWRYRSDAARLLPELLELAENPRS
ncbi:NACHT domain-containing protein [Paractinoplanes rishiriensis]|uniref:NACHT domain-containing protein n=1 Tax=Paractinoplanes rishiriensis TaxID=1050105 RepID=A0A919MWC3_9ACTN|nr:NACHT domain-containing protein [Actinoplanes rishiriensis]GIE94520.1 hypothetical protein Ari01nite_19850 [Actinoplanes rishiriensis]